MVSPVSAPLETLIPFIESPFLVLTTEEARLYNFAMGLGKARTNAPINAFLAILAVTFVLTRVSLAQVVSATLTGTVTDSSGAVVPGAMVTATETNTGVSRSTQTSAEGVYSLPFLNPGTYKVDVDKEGFKRFTEANLQLDVSSVGRVNAMLTPGSQKESSDVVRPLITTSGIVPPLMTPGMSGAG